MPKTIVVPDNSEYDEITSRYNFTDDMTRYVLQLYSYHKELCKIVLSFIDATNQAMYDAHNQYDMGYPWVGYRLTDIVICQRNEPNTVKTDLEKYGWDFELPIGFVNGLFVQLTYTLVIHSPVGPYTANTIQACALWTETRSGGKLREVHVQL